MTADVSSALMHPALLLLLGGLATPLVPAALRSAWSVLAALLAGASLLGVPLGTEITMAALGQALVILRLDALSLLFAVMFLMALLIALAYAMDRREAGERAAALVYAGGALGAVLAGDLLTLFAFLEIMALGAAGVIWQGPGEATRQAALRYLALHVASGVLFLIGAVIHVSATGRLGFDAMSLDATPGASFIFLAIGIKAAFPLLGAWLPDAYARATPTGSVFLCAFTTKVAVYALMRGFPGTEVLVPIGAAMAIWAALMAFIEPDLRRVAAYHVMNELGFMVAAIGVGTPLALAGAGAYALASIPIALLLFMVTGAVAQGTGNAQVGGLGGLWRSMPWTASFALLAGAAAMGLPLTAAFAGKTFIIDGLAEAGITLAWLALLLGSVGAIQHAGLKIPYFAFFAEPAAPRMEGREASPAQLFAMAMAGSLCLAMGLFPDLVLSLLPGMPPEPPAGTSQFLKPLQLAVFAALAFALLLRLGLYPRERARLLLDTDWLYRRARPVWARLHARAAGASWRGLAALGGRLWQPVERFLFHQGPARRLGRGALTGTMALWVAVILAATLLVIYSTGA